MPPDLDGFNRLIAHEYDLQNAVAELKRHIREQGQERRKRRAEDEHQNQGAGESKPKLVRKIPVPAVMTKPEQLDRVLTDLKTAQADLVFWSEFEITLMPEED